MLFDQRRLRAPPSLSGSRFSRFSSFREKPTATMLRSATLAAALAFCVSE